MRSVGFLLPFECFNGVTSTKFFWFSQWWKLPLWGREVTPVFWSCLLRFGVDVDEYEGPEERASRVARSGEMKQMCNISKVVSIVAIRKTNGEKAVLYLGVKCVLPGEG